MKDRAWNPIMDKAAGKTHVAVIGCGASTDVGIKSIPLEKSLIITTNSMAQNFGSHIHVGTDGPALDHWLHLKGDRQIWAACKHAFGHGPRASKKYPQPPEGVVLIDRLWPTRTKFPGSGCEALWIGYEIAKWHKLHLISTGIDLGMFWPINGKGRYCTFAEAGRNAPIEKMMMLAPGEDVVAIAAPKLWKFTYGEEYQRQRNSLAILASIHEKNPNAVRSVRSLSAIDWTRLAVKNKLSAARDRVIIRETISFLQHGANL